MVPHIITDMQNNAYCWDSITCKMVSSERMPTFERRWGVVLLRGQRRYWLGIGTGTHPQTYYSYIPTLTRLACITKSFLLSCRNICNLIFHPKYSRNCISYEEAIIRTCIFVNMTGNRLSHFVCLLG